MNYASFGRRVVSYSIDFLVLLLVLLPIFWLLTSAKAQHVLFDYKLFQLEEFSNTYLFVEYIKALTKIFLSMLNVQQNIEHFIVVYSILFIPYFLYFILQQSSSPRQTIGMWIMKLHFIQLEAKPISVKLISIRFAILHVWFVVQDWLFVMLAYEEWMTGYVLIHDYIYIGIAVTYGALLLNALMIIFSEKKQGFHDMLTGVVVVHDA